MSGSRSQLSGAHPSGAQAEGGADPSMEDILASIRRILSEEDLPPDPPMARAPEPPEPEPPDDPGAFEARMAALRSDLVEPARSKTYDELGDGRRALTIATRWLAPKLG